MHLRLSTNFSFRRFDLVLGPSLHRLPPQQPHLLHDPLLDRIGLLEVSLAVLYRPNYRRESISKTRVRLETGQNRLVAKFRGRHLLKSHPFPNPNLTPHHFESHPMRQLRSRSLSICCCLELELDFTRIRSEFDIHDVNRRRRITRDGPRPGGMSCRRSDAKPANGGGLPLASDRF